MEDLHQNINKDFYRDFKEEVPEPPDPDVLFKNYFDDARAIGMSIIDARNYARMHTRDDMERHKKLRKIYKKPDSIKAKERPRLS